MQSLPTPATDSSVRGFWQRGGAAIVLPTLACLLASVVLAYAVQRSHEQRDLLGQQQKVAGQLQVMRDRLVAQAQASFSPTSGLSTLIQTDGTISQERFAKLVERSLRMVPYIRSVVAAPNDVVRYVHPLAGNERVLNLDYRSVPLQWKQVQLAREIGSPIIAAPVKLVQGGIAVVQRNPVFLLEQKAVRYWGVVSVVVDLDRFLEASGISPSKELSLVLLNPSAPVDQRVVWGDAKAEQADAVRTSIQLDGAQWALVARPHAGWSSAVWGRETWAVVLAGLLVTLLVALLSRNAQHLRLRHQELSLQVQRSEQDRHALRQSQAETVATRDHLQAVLDAATEVAIVSTDLHGEVTVFNRGAQFMLGYDEAEVIGKSPALWHDLDQIQATGREISAPGAQAPQGFAVFAQLAGTQGAKPRSWTYIHKDGARLEVSLALSTVYAHHGEPTGFLGVARDLSAQRQAELALRQLTQDLEQRVQARTVELQQAMTALEQAQEYLLQSEKLAALGRLVAGVAHELNTPIGNCLTTASALSDRTQVINAQLHDAQIKRSTFEAYLHGAQEASELLLRGLGAASEMVQHFKQLAVDQTSEQRRSFTLEAVVNDVLALSKVQWKSTPFKVLTSIGTLPPMDGYPGALGRVLGNLLQNALLHGFEKRTHGTVHIRAQLQGDDTVVMEIADDGIGMSEDVRRRAFDPFFTTKLGRGGSGLGLNIVHNTVTGVLGGRLALTSTLGHGSHFVLHLPLVAPFTGNA